MKKNLKILIPSVFIALTCLVLPAHSTKEFLETGEQGIKRPYSLMVSRDSDITGKFQQKKRRGEEIRENPFIECPIEITCMILELAAIGNYLSNSNIGNLSVVCRDWRDIMAQEQMKKSLKKSIELIKYEKIYERFLKGVLVYRPDGKSDKGRIDLPVAALENPLEGMFDLSQCGDVGKYLTISTGYRKGKKAENAKKLEIWLTPRFLVEKEIQGSAQHFKEVFPSEWPEKAPIGVFYTWGKWDDLTWYNYLTTQNYDEISNNNLYEISHDMGGAAAEIRRNFAAHMPLYRAGVRPSLKCFHIHFVN
jgi:hypothetical protein